MVHAPGSKVTWPPLTRARSPTCNLGSTRTVPVNHASEPLPEGREPLRLISIVPFLPVVESFPAGACATLERADASAANPATPESTLLRVITGAPPWHCLCNNGKA